MSGGGRGGAFRLTEGTAGAVSPGSGRGRPPSACRRARSPRRDGRASGSCDPRPAGTGRRSGGDLDSGDVVPRGRFPDLAPYRGFVRQRTLPVALRHEPDDVAPDDRARSDRTINLAGPGVDATGCCARWEQTRGQTCPEQLQQCFVTIFTGGNGKFRWPVHKGRRTGRCRPQEHQFSPFYGVELDRRARCPIRPSPAGRDPEAPERHAGRGWTGLRCWCRKSHMAEDGSDRDAGRKLREQRRAAALRANLHRRKAQARMQAQDRGPDGEGMPPSGGLGPDPRQD